MSLNPKPFDGPGHLNVNNINVLQFVAPLPLIPEYMEDALEGIVRVNVRYLNDMKRLGRPVPRIDDAQRLLGIRYKLEEVECFEPIFVILSRGWGDCDGLASWEAAERRVNGQKAKVKVRKSRSGRPGAYHALVSYFDGTAWQDSDPSLRLGMGKPGQRGV